MPLYNYFNKNFSLFPYSHFFALDSYFSACMMAGGGRRGRQPKDMGKRKKGKFILGRFFFFLYLFVRKMGNVLKKNFDFYLIEGLNI